MKRLIAFALALAVVFGVSFALYKPERIEAAAQETMDDEWVGYFFALEPFDGKVYATENGDDYDFGVPGVPVFVTITAFEPDDPDYEEGSEFKIPSVRRCPTRSWAAECTSRSTTTAATRRAEDRARRWGQAELYECYVYRIRGGLLCQCTQATARTYVTGHRSKPGPDADDLDRAVERLARERKTRNRSIKVAFHSRRTRRQNRRIVWMDSEKNVLSRAHTRRPASPERRWPHPSMRRFSSRRCRVDGTTERTLCTQDDLFARTYVPSTLPDFCALSMLSLDWERTRLNQFLIRFAKKMIAIRGQSG